MNHNFMPGDIVKYDGKIGEVISRGASRGRYYVQLLFPGGKRIDVVNDDIKKIKRS